MSVPESEQPTASTRPYLIRALYEWCTDNGFTPYIAVQTDETVQVPREYVRNGEIVLNISADATSMLALDNDYIRFKARFDGVVREIIVPIDRVMAIYARENGQGMAFVVPAQGQVDSSTGAGKDTVVPGGEETFRNSHVVAAGDPVVKGSATLGGRGDIHLVSTTPTAPDADDGLPPPPPRPRPTLKRIK